PSVRSAGLAAAIPHGKHQLLRTPAIPRPLAENPHQPQEVDAWPWPATAANRPSYNHLSLNSSRSRIASAPMSKACFNKPRRVDTLAPNTYRRRMHSEVNTCPPM